MPEQSHPPYVTAAKQYPRRLNTWLDINAQNGPLRRTATTIVLPAFTAANSWIGVSDIITSFNFEAPNNFSFKAFVAPSSPNYALCVSYRVGTKVTRYLMWDATGSALNAVISAYTGQVIKKNFRFEVWSTSQGNASQTAALTFSTSVLGDVDYRYGLDAALVGSDGQVTDFTAPASVDVFPSYTQVHNAGQGAVNANCSFAGSKNGAAYYKYISGEIYIYWSVDRWIIATSLTDTSLICYYATGALGDLLTDGQGLTHNLVWKLGPQGINPVPTISNDGTTVSFFPLSMVFPTNAASTTN